MYICIYLYIHIYKSICRKVAIESWPELDLNPRSLNSVQTLRLTIPFRP